MDLRTFYEEYDNLSEERKIAGLKAFFDEILRDVDQYDDFIQDMLDDAVDLEQDDYWGTEGANI